MSNDWHIGISYQEDIPVEFIEEFIEAVSFPGLDIKHEPRERGVYANLEWAIPTLVIAYLAKPYFEGFLNEAGKDHYQLLKQGTLALFVRLFGEKPEKRPPRRTPLFSLVAKLEDGRSIKFIFPEGALLNEYEESLDCLYELLSEHYSHYPMDRLTSMVAELSSPSRSLYVEYVPRESTWVLIDPLKEAQKARIAQEERNK